MFRLVRFSLKAGVTGAALYYTVDQGVWRDSEASEKLYKKLENEVTPYVAPYIPSYIKNIQLPFELPTFPETGNMVGLAQVTWNKGVIKLFSFLADSPDMAWDYMKQGAKLTYQTLSEQLQSETVVEVKTELSKSHN